MFDLYADKALLEVREREPVTSGSVNACQVRFTFSGDWEGLSKTAVFRAGDQSRAVPLDNSGETAIPWEILKKPDCRLSAGVYGQRGEDMVLPTVWADLGPVLEGAAPGAEAQPPTPDLWRRELDRKGDNLDLSGQTLRLRSGEEVLSQVDLPAGGGAEGPSLQFGHGLKVLDGTLSVEAVDDFSGDNTLPMTAAGVDTVVGNIEAILATI